MKTFTHRVRGSLQGQAFACTCGTFVPRGTRVALVSDGLNDGVEFYEAFIAPRVTFDGAHDARKQSLYVTFEA
jgi:hypothetical protein